MSQIFPTPDDPAQRSQQLRHDDFQFRSIERARRFSRQLRDVERWTTKKLPGDLAGETEQKEGSQGDSPMQPDA